MKIKPFKAKECVLMKLNCGDIFKLNDVTYLKIRPIIGDKYSLISNSATRQERFNCVDISNGELYSISPDRKVECYNDAILLLEPNKGECND